MDFDEKDMLACCGSAKFAREMVLASPFASLGLAVSAARDIWFNRVDVSGWLEAFPAHPQIGESPSSNTSNAGWSKGEQSTAVATATDSSLQELAEWNARYRQKFGHIFIILASGRSTGEILAELKKRYSNRPIVGFEMAATEQIKITEIVWRNSSPLKQKLLQKGTLIQQLTQRKQKAIKEKISDMRAMQKAKSEARAEEQEVKERAKAEKELAKAKVKIAYEVRKAKEAEAEMNLHVAKANQRAQEEIAKHTSSNQNQPPNATDAAGAVS